MPSSQGVVATGFIIIGLLAAACAKHAIEGEAREKAGWSQVDLREALTIRHDESGSSFVLAGVNFDGSSARLDAKAKRTLAPLAAYLRNHPDQKIIVHGHTDDTGNYNFNITLSERRAIAVKNALVVENNISPERILTLGHGPNEPIADNETAEGRRKNRRIEIIFIGAADATASN